MKRSFRSEYIEIKRKTVNLYVVMSSLSEQFGKIRDEQKSDFFGAVVYMKERIATFEHEIEKVRENVMGESEDSSRGIKGLIIKSKTEKLNSLQDELNECKKCLDELIEKMKQRWGS